MTTTLKNSDQKSRRHKSAWIAMGAAALALGPMGAAQASAAFSGADSHVVYQGRTVPFNDQYSPDGKAVKFYWEGTEIHIKFHGSTTFRMNLRVSEDRDGSGNLLVPGFAVPFCYILDGTPLTNSNGSLRQDSILTLGDTQTVATGLSTGTHTLVIRDNGDTASQSWLESIVLDNGAALDQADPLPNRRIEFYGDSTTFASPLSGPNVPGPNDDPNDDQFWTASSYNAYTGQTGRNLNADYRIIGKGGIGVSYGAAGTPMLSVWNRLAFSTAEPLYDLTQWTPDVVVVGLGQNDKSFIGQGGSYDVAYTKFVADYLTQVRNLRTAYPNAVIVCMNTTMTDPTFFVSQDGINGPFTHLQTDSEFATARTNGKLLVHTFTQQGFGFHPKAIQHKLMADSLTQWISNATGWSAAAVSANIANGIYALTPSCATACRLDDSAGGTTNGSNVQIWTNNGLNPQRWYFTRLSDGYYKITSQQATGLCVDVSNSGTTDGTNVQLYADNGTSAQEWLVTDTGSGTYKLSPKCAPGACLDVSNASSAAGTNVQIWTDNGTNAQRWTFTAY
ncbi:hypothetical protein CCAX7_000160 [Capsulimonas corticalis]|uniref:Uncharacterized protein n=1 Tax=Capsulimonas corticalis TaxID=2219043 RepID=A0A402CRJ6_9BACT|nr:RICIN domain-containing protein [Capsulimonas corticalis]BDI27965.1 hypothetical protein CCAX7_000160 [Capsulimonas corticalis]